MLRFTACCTLVLLSTAWSCVLGETGCPDEEAIAPCKCTKRPGPTLVCGGIRNLDDLLPAFRASERYTYQEVHIVDSEFMYFPVHVLGKTTVKELYFRNSTFISLVDKYRNLGGQYEYPYKISVDDVKILRGLSTPCLSSLTNLTELRANLTPVDKLHSGFTDKLPKSLKRFELYGTHTKEIKSGALSGLPNLDKFVVKDGNLKNLNRDIFSRPFNGRILNFDNNKIISIPDDMFTEMPNLQFLSMRNNIISIIPEAAFSGRKFNVPVFTFGGNPLVCDCQVQWIVQDKPMILEGHCASPDAFKGRELRKIKPNEFEC